MRTKVTMWALLVVMALAAQAAAQTPPRLVRFDGVVRDAHGQSRTGALTLTFGIYGESEGGAPLWVEVQTATLDAQGRYAVALGATRPEGLPLELFTTGEPRWLGVQPEGQPEASRVLLLSVPYALKAADADTVGGKPLSAFVLAGDSTGKGADGLTYVNPRTLSGVTGTATGPLATSGTAGYLGMFLNSTDLGNSAIFQAGNSIGVGTTSPVATFHSVSTVAPGAFFDVFSNSLEALPLVFRAARGTAGSPTAVQTHDILGGLAVRAYGATAFSGGQGQVMFKAAENWTDTAHGTYLQITTTPPGSVSWVERLRIDAAGNVGIGTSTPAAKLHVAGDAIVDGNLAAKYQDVAEWVASAEPLAAGTVVVVDPTARDGVRGSGKAYDVGVAGAVSAQPGLILGEQAANKVLVAQSGRVRVKVDAQYGAIKAGDLLVTSPTPGHAMRSKPVVMNGVAMHRPGTIVGKALEPLAKGKGEILVLLTLQ